MGRVLGSVVHTMVHLLGLDRSGLAWYPVVGEVEEREQNIRAISKKENNISFILVLFFNCQSKLN
jgi:hypothetical protein